MTARSYGRVVHLEWMKLMAKHSQNFKQNNTLKLKPTNMSDTTKNNTEDTLNTQLSTDENHNSNYLQRHEEIEGTPFHFTGSNEEGWFLRMGDFRMSPNLKTQEDVELWLHNNNWNVIMSMIGSALTRYEKNKHLFNNIDQKIDEEIEKSKKTSL